MATITTPAAGVSPYPAAAAVPTVLRAAADGTTVLANAVTASATVSELAATNANTLVVVNGQAALNSLITTGQPGVFEGANVTINLEEQLFNTTNQVTATTNYPSGNTGEIQFNSGSNSFASNAYFTYNNSNVITPGIRTDGYFYSNGSPFIGGGNAAIGNFVFTGDTMTTNNPTLYITANGDSNLSVTSIKNVSNAGNSDIILNRAQVAITSGTSNTWTFLADGGTIFPTLTTQRGDNPSGTISGQTLLFGNSLQEAIISTPDGTVGNEYSQRLVINPGAGNNYGEGGDIYLWAGRGGDGSGSGGDIKIRGGQGGANTTGGTGGDGGYIRMEAGDAAGTGGPGYIQITGGYSNTQGGYVSVTGGVGATVGGDVKIYGGYGQATGGNVNIWGGPSGNGQVNEGHVNIQTGGNTWTFAADGNLTLPANIIAINYANGNRVTGNVTFSSEIVIGTGTSNLISGLYLAPSSSSANANMYLRVRGNIVDEPTHIHFDTGNNAYYNQFIGDDNKYIQLANTGNIVINSNDVAGNSAQWNFDYDGVLTLPNADASGFGNIYFEQNSSTITFGLDDNATPFLYSFATSGITLPKGGATIRDTVGNAVAFGRDAAATGPQGNAAVAIGQQAGETSQGASAVAIGYQAGLNTQGANSVAIGTTAGNSAQGDNSVAIGTQAGQITQGQFAVAIGDNAGNNAQGTDAVAIGASAGLNSQGNGAVAFGQGTGETLQGNNAVALGKAAGQINQGINSIAIGQSAGLTNQGNNSIILNATGLALDQTTANTFTVAPVRNDVANIAEVMFYNTTSNEITYGNTISVTGNITGNYFTGNGAGLTDVGAASVPGQTILPTIQTITVSDTSGVGNAGGGGSAFANVTVANVTPVTEYGVIVTSGTSSQKYATGALGSIPGTVKLSFTTGLNSTPFTVYAYVTSNAGTYYSNSATGTSGICLLAGTQIALSDGTHKAIEHITYTDKLLSWDFDRGCYAETTAVWIKRSETGSQYNLLTFSDGTTLRTFDQHRIFNKQAGAFTYPMTAETPVGTVTVNEHGQEITLTNKQVIKDTIEYYNVITDYHMNLFSDSVLTSCRFNNIYPIVDMKFVKDNRTLRTRAEFENVEDRFFHGLRLAEQTADIETVEWYVNRLLRTEVSTQAELAF